MRKFLCIIGLAALWTLALGSSALAGPGGHRLFLKSATENADLSRVTLPLYRGTSHGDTVWYILTDASTRSAAKAYGINYAPKLALAANTAAAQKVTWGANGFVFPATVDFRPARSVVAGPYGPNEAGLPLTSFTAGAIGEPGYSPLIQLPDGTVLNASHIATSTGKADKAHDLVLASPGGSVSYEETSGFYGGHTIHYISVDASASAAAMLENVTWAPSLAAAPGGDPDDENLNGATSSRAGIIAFTNGQTGIGHPNRQGLNSTILDGPLGVTNASGPVPLNIIQSVPTGGVGSTLYSPLWDAHLTRWIPSIPLAQRTRQTSFEDVQALAAAGKVTNVDGSAWGRSGPVPNCPIISTDRPGVVAIPQPN
ncbi:MAG TPA: hypothetical protein VNI55_10855 [Gaiellaceae bacterium]|nr:hypothetical protein [Gaiellaceae bacterium]